MTINIANDYTKTPGGRLISEGKYSGEDFRKKILKPKYLKARENKEELVVDLDGGFGYGSSFLEEAFGGLVRDLKDKNILDIKIVSNEEPQLIDDIHGYISDELSRQRVI